MLKQMTQRAAALALMSAPALVVLAETAGRNPVVESLIIEEKEVQR